MKTSTKILSTLTLAFAGTAGFGATPTQMGTSTEEAFAEPRGNLFMVTGVKNDCRMLEMQWNGAAKKYVPLHLYDYAENTIATLTYAPDFSSHTKETKPVLQAPQKLQDNFRKGGKNLHPSCGWASA